MAISPEVEQALRDMSDGEWSALVAKVRAPDAAEQLREFVESAGIAPAAAAAFLEGRNPAAFLGDDGRLDVAKVRANMAILLGVNVAAAGAAGRAEAQRRFGNPGYVTGGRESTSADDRRFGAGAAGRAEAQRRFGTSAGNRAQRSGEAGR